MIVLMIDTAVEMKPSSFYLYLFYETHDHLYHAFIHLHLRSILLKLFQDAIDL